MNPFKPTAGKMPPILIGRESVIRDFEEALDKEHVIEADGKGYVRLSTPHMAEYLRGSSW